MKFLIVDDSKVVREFVKDALQAIGQEVHTASDIFIASQVMTLRPDVILMDVTVSTQSGPIAVETLKKRGLAGDATILLLSAQPESSLKEIARACGADGYVHKSSDPDVFRARVATALKASGKVLALAQS